MTNILDNPPEIIRGYRTRTKRNSLHFTGATRETRGREFSARLVENGRIQVSLLSSGTGSKPRKRLIVESLDDLVYLSEIEFWGASTFASPDGPTIAQVFSEWLTQKKGQVKATTYETDYKRRALMFTDWTDQRGLVYWREITPRLVQEYVNKGAKRYSKAYVVKRIRPVTMAARFVKFNYPEWYRDLDILMPRCRDTGKRKQRYTPTLIEAVNFLAYIAQRPHGWNHLPGLAIQALASARMQEVKRLTWQKIDLDRGLITFDVDPKNPTSHRTIPACGLLMDILHEAYERQRPKPADPVVPTFADGSYRNGFNRPWTAWWKQRADQDLLDRPEATPLQKPRFECYGLRRVLVQHMRRIGHYGIQLQLYRGHKPELISNVDWYNYMDPIDVDSEGSIAIFREMVTDVLDRDLERARQEWSERRRKVVQLARCN